MLAVWLVVCWPDASYRDRLCTRSPLRHAPGGVAAAWRSADVSYAVDFLFLTHGLSYVSGTRTLTGGWRTPMVRAPMLNRNAVGFMRGRGRDVARRFVGVMLAGLVSEMSVQHDFS